MPQGAAGVACAVAGGLILALLSVDVFLTVFHAQGHGGPLSRWQNRAVWAVFRRLGVRGDGTPRDAFLGFGAPAMIVLTMVMWMAMLVGGFALVYLPWMDGFLASPGALREPWLEALYFSGYTATTLGIGDLVPDHGALRLLTPLQAFSGFALLSAAITYLLAVYRELIAMQALASRIAAYRRALDRRHAGTTDDPPREPLARWAENVAAQLIYVIQAHFQYPVLHYFRPSDLDRALPVQLGPLLDTGGPLAGRPEADVAPAQHHPSILLLEDAVGRYLRIVEDVFVPDRFADGPGGIAEAAPDHRAHVRLKAYMRYPGEPSG